MITTVTQLKPISIIAILFLLICSNPVKAQIIDTMINAGTYSLHFKIIKGQGKSILFENGGGNDISQLDKIINPIYQATHATIITYDREGFGKSGIDTLNFNILHEIKGLEYSLKRLGYDKSELVIVCHSLGAFYAQVYASRHPKLVKGIVMLDPRIGSYSDMVVAKQLFDSIDQKKLKQDNLGLYYVLSNMEQNSDFVRRSALPKSISILLIMAEYGPYDRSIENKAFTLRQRQFIQQFPNGFIHYAKGSTHNIPQDKPLLAINEVVSFWRKYINKSQ